jgi:putative hemolysin
MSPDHKFWLVFWVSAFVCATVMVVGIAAFYQPGPDDSILCLKEGGKWEFHPARNGNDTGYCDRPGDRKDR